MTVEGQQVLSWEVRGLEGHTHPASESHPRGDLFSVCLYTSGQLKWTPQLVPCLVCDSHLFAGRQSRGEATVSGVGQSQGQSKPGRCHPSLLPEEQVRKGHRHSLAEDGNSTLFPQREFPGAASTSPRRGAARASREPEPQAAVLGAGPAAPGLPPRWSLRRPLPTRPLPPASARGRPKRSITAPSATTISLHL